MMVELFLEADGVVFGYCGKFIGQGLLLEHCYIIIGGNSIRLVYASGWNFYGWILAIFQNKCEMATDS